MVGLVIALLGFSAAGANDRARELYRKTQYREALDVLANAKDPESLQLAGQCWIGLGDYKKAIEVLERAGSGPTVHLWLGRAWGRRAESSNPLMAPRYATRARDNFEKAVALDPKSVDAMSDLFEYYLQAPGFLGGGKEKAAAMAKKIAAADAAQGHLAEAMLAEDRKDWAAAEKEFRLAAEAAPGNAGRLVDLAKFLVRRGRHGESDEVFGKANSAAALYERAAAYVEARRNPDQARALLKRYLESALTPDDPPRAQAEKLLNAIH